MYIASFGFSKFCFLISLAFCGLLLLLIPVLKPTCQVDLPQPRPQVRPAQTDPSLNAWFKGVSKNNKETQFANRQEGSSEGKSEVTLNDAHKRTTDYKDRTVLGRKGGVLSQPKTLESLELKDIFIAVKTTKKYHRTRLQLLIQTWISQAKEEVRFDYWVSQHYFEFTKQALVISCFSQYQRWHDNSLIYLYEVKCTYVQTNSHGPLISIATGI